MLLLARWFTVHGVTLAQMMLLLLHLLAATLFVIAASLDSSTCGCGQELE